MVNNYLFFDSASTTKCCDEALRVYQKYAIEDFGNPSSTHELGLKSARAIREARSFFARLFYVEPEQVIFTGSGSEANNLAIYGTVTSALEKKKLPPFYVVASAIEHPSVKKTVESLDVFGAVNSAIQTEFFSVNSDGKIDIEAIVAGLHPNTLLLSIQQVNQVVGAILPVEALAKRAKEKIPHLIVHTDAIQAFGKLEVPTHPSPVDLVSLSGHKIEGPKGVGALIVLNKKLLQGKLRPLIWGGGQENGFRSGTQNAGLIAGFQAAAKLTLGLQKSNTEHVLKLRKRFRECLEPLGKNIVWNSPEEGLASLISISVPGFPSGPLVRLLEERNCLVSMGSACQSRKPEPDPVLKAMGFSPERQTSALRISLSRHLQIADMEYLAQSLHDSIQVAGRLLGKKL